MNKWKTFLMIFANLGSEITKVPAQSKLDQTEITSQHQMKVLGVTFDSALKWNVHIEKLTNKCRSYLYGLRYLRKHLSLDEISKVLKAQIVSLITYGSPVWYHRVDYRTKAKIKSTYYHILRVMVRDFRFRLNKFELLELVGMEDIWDVLSKRSSCFLFKIIQNLSPTNITGVLLSKSYSNERTPGRLSFFDCSKNKNGKTCLSNNARNIVNDWRFDWLPMSLNEFKNALAAQFDR